MIPVSALGALAALSIAIFLILKKVPPAYGMIVGALAGGLIGGADLTQTVALMIGGAQGITTAVMRILAAGVLAGVLIESGAATTIAETIVKKLGETRALLALALATLILTAVALLTKSEPGSLSPSSLCHSVDQLPDWHSKHRHFVHRLHPCQRFTDLRIVISQAQFRADELFETIHRCLGF